MERTFSTYLNEEPYFGAKLPNGWKRVSSGDTSSPYFYTYMGTNATWTPPEINFIEAYNIIRQNPISDELVFVLDIPENCPIVEVVRNIYSMSEVKAEPGKWNQGETKYDTFKDVLPMFCKLANDAGAKVIVPTEIDFKPELNRAIAEVAKAIPKSGESLEEIFIAHCDTGTSISVPAWTILFYITKGMFQGGGLSIYPYSKNVYSGEENPISPFSENNGIRVVIMRGDVKHKPEGIIGLGADCERGVVIFQLPAPNRLHLK
jgi:hypothetical protein